MNIKERSESPIGDPEMDGSVSRGRLSLHKVEMATDQMSSRPPADNVADAEAVP